MMIISPAQKFFSLFLTLILLTGCTAAYTTVAKRNLAVETKMSDSIFLTPVAPSKRTVFVDVRNTSDNPEFDMKDDVVMALKARGYKVVDDPAAAQYLLQANVLQAGLSDDASKDKALAAGFGGGLAGGAIGKFSTGSNKTAIAGAIAGALISGAAEALVKDVTYSIITDVQVSEKSATTVYGKETQKIAQGSSGYRTFDSSEESPWKVYRTRIMSKANQANLDVEDAMPPLRQGMSRSIAGIF